MKAKVREKDKEIRLLFLVPRANSSLEDVIQFFSWGKCFLRCANWHTTSKCAVSIGTCRLKQERTENASLHLTV